MAGPHTDGALRAMDFSHIFFVEKRNPGGKQVRDSENRRWTEKLRDKHLETTSPTAFRNFGHPQHPQYVFLGNLKLGFHSFTKCIY